MPESRDASARLVSLADVAKLAGVTRPAVSNWRRRYEDFPRVVRETGTASLFALADIDEWLARHRKNRVTATVRDAVASVLNTVRADVTITRAVEIGMAVLGAHVIKPFEDWTEASDPFDIVRHAMRVVDERLAKAPRFVTLDDVDGAGPLVAALPRLVTDYSVVSVAEALLAEATEQERATNWRTTPRSLADLMIALAGDLSGSVYSPYCGTGTTLLAAAAVGKPPTELVGEEGDPTAYQLATLRMIIHGVAATVHWYEDAPSLMADFVFADPPFDRDHDAALLMRTAEMINSPGGRGVHVSPNTVLVRAADRVWREILINNGVVEAVVQLPPLHAGAGVRPALWLLRPFGAAKSPTVLLIDASKAGTKRGSAVELGQQDIDAIVSVYRSWQKAGVPQEGEFPALAVATEQLLAGQCRLDLDSWVDDEPNVRMSLAHVHTARRVLQERRGALAKLRIPNTMGTGHVERRPIHELVYYGEAELLRGVRLADSATGAINVIGPEGLGDDLVARVTKKVELDVGRRGVPVSRPGDIVISVEGPTVRAAVVPTNGAVLQAPLQCLRLRRMSKARARTIAALLSADVPSVPYAEVRDLVVRWPSDNECEQIDRSLEAIISLRLTAAEVNSAAGYLMSSTFKALAAGAVPDRLAGP